MMKAIYIYGFNTDAGTCQVEEIITNLFGCQKQTLQFLIGSLQLRFVPIVGAEMDNLLPRQALFGKQLPSLLSFHLNGRTNVLLIQQH